MSQGILSVPGIAGYKWVPARIGRFINTIFFHNSNGQLKTGKTGTHSSADTSPVQCSLFELSKLTKQQFLMLCNLLICPYCRCLVGILIIKKYFPDDVVIYQPYQLCIFCFISPIEVQYIIPISTLDKGIKKSQKSSSLLYQRMFWYN